jgi:hypothetical protein
VGSPIIFLNDSEECSQIPQNTGSRTLAQQLQSNRRARKPFQEVTMSKTTGDDWRQLAEAAQKEQDPTKLMELINELNHKLERRARDLESHPSPMAD